MARTTSVTSPQAGAQLRDLPVRARDLILLYFDGMCLDAHEFTSEVCSGRFRESLPPPSPSPSPSPPPSSTWGRTRRMRRPRRSYDPENPNFKPSQLDASILLASLHTDAPDDRFFAPTDDRVLATAHALARTFRSRFPINQVVANGDGRALQPGIGRYPEDVYDGDGFSGGNPWFLATAALAELCYRAADQWAAAEHVPVTERNVEFLRSAIASEGSPETGAGAVAELLGR